MAEVLAKTIGKRFPDGQQALRDIQLHVAPGEFVAIVGPSGCGKSTLLRMIAGLTAVSQGELKVAGLSPFEARSRWHRLAFVFQEANLMPWRTVRANIRLPLELQRIPPDERAARVEASLRLIGLNADDGHKRPAMLSGGMRMRVSLARALVTQPDLMLLDEPFAALDDLIRGQLNEELIRIWLEQQWTATFVTHNVSEAVYLSERVIVMSPSPGTIVGEVKIPFGYPRSPEFRSEPEFARACGDVTRMLRGGT